VIDSSFIERDHCSSSFKGKYEDRDFTETGFKANEFEILEENGIMEKLKYTYSWDLFGYDSAAHKKFDYTLFQKQYPFWLKSCSQKGESPR
jgi:hypothetical protein